MVHAKKSPSIEVLSALLHHMLHDVDFPTFAVQLWMPVDVAPVLGITMTMTFAPLGCAVGKLKVCFEFGVLVACKVMLAEET